MAMFENFPYTDMHNLNLDWIIKIAKDFLDQYTHIQELIANGEESLQNLTTEGLQQLQDKADALETLLNEWYNTHSEDIADQLADALQDLNDWYTTHQAFLDQYVTDNITYFNTRAEQKMQSLLDSIPPEYDSYVDEIRNNSMAYEPVNRLKYAKITTGAYRYYNSGEIRSNENYCYSDYIVVEPDSLYKILNASNTHTTFYDVNRDFVSGTLESKFVIPSNAVYMVVSYNVSDTNIQVIWDENILNVKPFLIVNTTDTGALTDFNNAEWNKIYVFNLNNESDWENISHNPIKRNGVLLTIKTTRKSTMTELYGARHIYITDDGFVYTRYYAPPISDFSNWTGSFAVAENTLTNLNNAMWNKWYIFHEVATNYSNVLNMPTFEDGTLFTYDNIRSDHYAGRQIYVTNTGKIYTRYYIPAASSFTPWESSVKGGGLLYHAKLTASNKNLFAGTFTADANGFEITNKAIFGRYYSIENRHCTWLFYPSADTNIDFYTAYSADLLPNFVVNINMENNTVKVLPFETVNVPWLTGGHYYTITISKEYQKLTVKLTDMNTGDTYDVSYINNGGGGAGAGQISEPNNVPMQYDYYGCRRVDGTPVILKELTITCETADVVLYGDSITEPEAYYPTDIFEKSWTQLVINHSSQKCVTSGRGGSSMSAIIERIVNELPYINAKYCVITIGTNTAPTETQWNNLIKIIKTFGAIPIINHIPCYNNNGDTTGYKAINTLIDTIRATYNLNGCDMDKATSIFYDGDSVNTDMMFYEDYTDRYFYHHPNVKGSASIFAQIKIDIPEIL